MQKSLNLDQAFNLFQLQEQLLNAKSSILGEAVRLAVQKHRTHEAIQMINDQLALGYADEVEKVIGAPALELIKRIS